MTQTARTIRKDILEMTKRIVREFHPERIILFGSHARGEGIPGSDVDLLVVMAVKGSKREAQVEIRRTLRGILIPKDIVISRPDEFAWRKEIVGTIEYPAVREGEVLYAKP